MFALDLLAGFLGAFLLLGPAIYSALDVIPGEEPVDYPQAAATALVAMLVAGSVDLLLGWIPAVGTLLSPLAWCLIVRRLVGPSRSASVAIGTATWALSRLLYAGLPWT